MFPQNRHTCADRGDEGVQHRKIAAEVVVEVEGKNRSEQTVEENDVAFREAGDVGESEPGGVERIVVRGPDVESEDDDSGDEESLLY